MQEIDRMIKLPELENWVALSKSTIYSQIAKGDFPPQIRLGSRCVAWKYSQIEEFLDLLQEGKTWADRETSNMHDLGGKL